ncbi:MAG: hypothetical protein ABIR70_12400 [Bryobacteraceae bacterium]
MTIFNQVRSNKFLRVASPVLALALFASLPATPQGKMKGGDNDPDRVITGGGLPAGWVARPDRGSADQEKVTESGGVLHFVMGAASIFHNNVAKTGDYKYSARVTQVKAPSHATSYGIMVGGKDLAGAGQTYTYFLVRGAGEYFISNREGAATATQVNWTADPAVVKQGADGKQANVLGVEVKGADVIFTVNGKEVKKLPKAGLHTDGIVGVRIGHNFDVDVDQISK